MNFKNYLLIISSALCLMSSVFAADVVDSGERDKKIKSLFAKIEKKKKGAFGQNVYACSDGTIVPYMQLSGVINPAPKGMMVFSAFRNSEAQELSKMGFNLGNLFATNYYEFFMKQKNGELADEGIRDYLLDILQDTLIEKFYIDNYPQTRLATSRNVRGVSGIELESRYYTKMLQDFSKVSNPFADYLLQYEIQRRFFISGDSSGKIRADVASIYESLSISKEGQETFYRIRNETHNMLNKGLSEKINAFIAKHKIELSDVIIKRMEKLSVDIQKYFTIDKTSIEAFFRKVDNANIYRSLFLQDDSVASIAKIVVGLREDFEKNRNHENLHLIIMLNRLAALKIKEAKSMSFEQELNLSSLLVDLSYASGMLEKRERDSLISRLQHGAKTDEEIQELVNYLSSALWWGQKNVKFMLDPSLNDWMIIKSTIHSMVDDTIRSSPLMLLGENLSRMQAVLAKKLGIAHNFFGKVTYSGLKGINPGLSLGVFKKISDTDVSGQKYNRNNIVGLSNTNAMLNPVSGILTNDEGNILSHVQLLARSFGIPNAAMSQDVYEELMKYDGKEIFYAVTPKGSVVIKLKSQMTQSDWNIYKEYNRNTKQSSDGSFKNKNKIHIPVEKLVLQSTAIKSLKDIRKTDSGVTCGPKAAYLGELMNRFPENVSRGVVVPFGAYKAHFDKAVVSIPQKLKSTMSQFEGKKLVEFVDLFYKELFGKMVNDTSLTEDYINKFVKDRLEIVEESIKRINLDSTLVEELRVQMASLGLLDLSTNLMSGVFVRSDTNVEDLDNFNGAGLNKTIFNVTTFEKMLAAIKEVWSSPFTFRSFSWRQAIIDDPYAVYPSIVILETVPSQKSGVMVTANTNTGSKDFFTIATSEGIGGTVDGTPAETLLVPINSSDDVTLISQYKSRLKNVASSSGISKASSTLTPEVLTSDELMQIVEAGMIIVKEFAAEISASGDKLPWDIEFGFVDGKLYLFQSRAFVGNSDIKNIPELTKLGIE